MHFDALETHAAKFNSDPDIHQLQALFDSTPHFAGRYGKFAMGLQCLSRVSEAQRLRIDALGRVLDDAVGKLQTGHGMVMPVCGHGGSGRVGGGGALGRLRDFALPPPAPRGAG